MVLSISPGHDVGYLTGAVAGGREAYYTGATAAGEPPGLWYGAGAEALGLAGEVDAELMEAVYTHLLDPRDPATHDRSTWGEAAALGKPHKNYKTAEDIYAAALEREPDAGPERRAEPARGRGAVRAPGRVVHRRHLERAEVHERPAGRVQQGRRRRPGGG